VKLALRQILVAQLARGQRILKAKVARWHPAVEFTLPWILAAELARRQGILTAEVAWRRRVVADLARMAAATRAGCPHASGSHTPDDGAHTG
jgi:hypothetical protein